MIAKKLSLLTLSCLLAGVANGAPQRNGSLHDLETKVDLLSKEVDLLKTKTTQLENSVGLFNFIEPAGIQKINTQAGFVYLSVQNTVPYDDGYKVTVRIGNPFVAIFEDVVVNFIWGTSEDETFQSVKLKSKLNASAWTNEEVFLSPVKTADYLKEVGISVQVGRVELLKGEGD